MLKVKLQKHQTMILINDDIITVNLDEEIDGHNSYRLSCEKCNQMWLDEDQLKYHMEMKHNKHVCVKCTSTLEGRENLRAHFREKHPAFVIASQLI